jgi:hypothetical protein
MADRAESAYDVHQHLWPEELVEALRRRPEAPRLRGARLELTVEPPSEVDLAAHDLDARLALLDRYRIDHALISLQPTIETETSPDLVDAYHEGMPAVVAASGGRLLALAAGRCLPGFAGACISAGALARGDDALLAELEAAGQILFVHPGPPTRTAPGGAPGWWPAVVDYTAQMQAAYMTWLARDAARHRGLPVIFAILAGGAPVQLERMRSRGVEVRTTLHDNVFLDTSSYGRRALELALATYGVTQLVFGSDAPVIDPAVTLASVHEFGDAVMDVVLRDNPARILGSPPVRVAPNPTGSAPG